MKKFKVCIVTGTRAEYGLLRILMKKFQNREDIDLKVVVTGSHLSSEFGLTYKEIEKDGINIDKKIEMLLSSDTSSGISKSIAIGIIGFADYFSMNKPDILIELGDRYELLSSSIAAMNERIPIAHIHGGESTQGAIDEVIRHSITKFSYLHFTSTEEYRNRVIQLGEDPHRVFSVGGLGVENIKNEPLLSLKELESALEFNLDKPYGVVTFHPTTLEGESASLQCEILLEACKTQRDMKFIFTKANADYNGRIINKLIENYVENDKNSIVFSSLGTTKYLSTLKYAAMIIGNSSSGIIEAPSFGVPTINIGDRQKGRIQASSVINSEPNLVSIMDAIKLAKSTEFFNISRNTINPYGDGDTSDKIIEVILKFLNNDMIDLKKQFYDLEVK